MLNEEIVRYAKLTGVNSSKVPISRIGGYLDGYDKGRNDAIDDFIEAMEKRQTENWVGNLEYGISFDDMEAVAKQLKSRIKEIDKEQENRYVDEKNPCEHAGVDYWYYPLTKEFYIALDEECSDKMFINYCPICGKKLPSYVFDIDVKEFED